MFYQLKWSKEQQAIDYNCYQFQIVGTVTKLPHSFRLLSCLPSVLLPYLSLPMDSGYSLMLVFLILRIIFIGQEWEKWQSWKSLYLSVELQAIVECFLHLCIYPSEYVQTWYHLIRKLWTQFSLKTQLQSHNTNDITRRYIYAKNLDYKTNTSILISDMLACLFDELFKSLSTYPNMYGFRNTKWACVQKKEKKQTIKSVYWMGWGKGKNASKISPNCVWCAMFKVLLLCTERLNYS